MIELQYFNGTEWTTVSTWANEWMAWVSLGGDDYNYRTIDENGKVLTDKSGEFQYYTQRFAANGRRKPT